MIPPGRRGQGSGSPAGRTSLKLRLLNQLQFQTKMAFLDDSLQVTTLLCFLLS